MKNTNDRYGVLIDGSALFLAWQKKGLEASLYYRGFLDVLKDLHRLDEDDDFAATVFFTSFTKGNAGQERLHETLRDLRFTVMEIPSWEANIGNRALLDPKSKFSYIRFDASIGYFLGTWPESKLGVNSVIVCSDSWPLNLPMSHAARQFKTLSHVFFGEQLDPRYKGGDWHADNQIKFMDLDGHIDRLQSKFGTAKLRGRGDSVSFDGLI
jgi:hypothetical protein